MPKQGQRVPEIIELTWKQLNLEKGIVSFEQRKRSRGRTLKLSSELISFLKSTAQTRDRVFITHYKEDFTYDKLRSLINEFKRKKLYRKSWSPADLRHSFAVNFLESRWVYKRIAANTWTLECV